MYKVVRKNILNSVTTLMEIEAPRVAAAAKPGQFLIVRPLEESERIPLTISDYNKEKGTVTIVTQVVGASSYDICSLEEGESFCDVVGPLGVQSEFVDMPVEELKSKRYLFIAGGLGAAPVYPQAKHLHSLGVKLDIILGAKTADLLILEKELQQVCDNLYICTDDGSKGFGGLVTSKMEQLVESGEKYDQAVTIGPMIMMKFVAMAAKKCALPLVASLNTLMVDGTGMCGACRVTVDGKTRFACVEGPEFDAHKIDFDEAIRRQGMYKTKEADEYHKCKIGRGK